MALRLKRFFRYLYPPLAVGLCLLTAFASEALGKSGAKTYLGVYTLGQYWVWIVAGLAIGLEHWLCPPCRSARWGMAGERLILAAVCFLLCFSPFFPIHAIHIWFPSMWALLAGYELAAGIACLVSKAD